MSASTGQVTHWIIISQRETCFGGDQDSDSYMILYEAYPEPKCAFARFTGDLTQFHSIRPTVDEILVIICVMATRMISCRKVLTWMQATLWVLSDITDFLHEEHDLGTFYPIFVAQSATLFNLKSCKCLNMKNMIDRNFKLVHSPLYCSTGILWFPVHWFTVTVTM